MPAQALSNNWSDNYPCSVYIALSEILRKEGIRMEAFVDPVSLEDSDHLPEELTRAVRARKFQAIFSLISDRRAGWIAKLGLPAASSGGDIAVSVSFDQKEIVRKSLGELRSRGCRSIGIITNMRISHTDDKPFFQIFTRECAKQGLELREEWIRNPVEYTTNCKTAEFGFRELLTLWSMKRRPQGLIVYPDIIVPGVVSAAFKLGLDSRRDISFLFHKNAGNAPFCPFDVSWVVSDPSATAKAMFDLVRQQVAGKKVSPVSIGVSIEKYGKDEYL
jgi:DNA-binding LacI/PurR family transcriptional regulator